MLYTVYLLIFFKIFSDSSLSNFVPSDQDQDSGHSACSSITAVGDGLLASPIAGGGGDRSSIGGPAASLSSTSSFAGSDVTSTTLVANNGNAGIFI